MEKALFIIMGFALSDWQDPPYDQPGCKIVKCPNCKREMWLSEKKRFTAKECPKEDLILVCNKCFEKIVMDNPGFFKKTKFMDITEEVPIMKDEL